MSVWRKIKGTIETFFQIGLGGPQLMNNSSVIEARNSGDTGFVVVRGAAPVGDNDLVTKTYCDQLAARYYVAQQFNGGSALPSNSSTEQFYVVTTSGANATIGQLLWDDGSNSGTVTVLAAATGRFIVCAAAFSGGTVTFSADRIYIWDGSAWQNAAGTQVTGAVREIRFAITNAASQSSATQIPANAIAVSAELDITTPYSAGATITVGQTGSAALLMGTGDNLATVAGLYAVDQDTAWGSSALAVLVTVAGTPAAGAGQCIVRYTVPDA